MSGVNITPTARKNPFLGEKPEKRECKNRKEKPNARKGILLGESQKRKKNKNRNETAE